MDFQNSSHEKQNEPLGQNLAAINPVELKDIAEADPHQNVIVGCTELNVHFSTVSQYLAILGNTKKLDQWAPHAPTQTRKHIILKCALCSCTGTSTKDF